jgi:hypothetical protein
VIVSDELKNKMTKPQNPEVGTWKEKLKKDQLEE